MIYLDDQLMLTNGNVNVYCGAPSQMIFSFSRRAEAVILHKLLYCQKVDVFDPLKTARAHGKKKSQSNLQDNCAFSLRPCHEQLWVMTSCFVWQV